MKIETLKSEFHELIDQINDQEILAQFYDALNRSTEKDGSLWRSLSTEQQEAILVAYDESNDQANLISFDAIKAKYKQWPLK